MGKKYTKREFAKKNGIHLTEDELTSNAYDLEKVGGIIHDKKLKNRDEPPQTEDNKKKVEYGVCPECGVNIQIWNCQCGDGHPY